MRLTHFHGYGKVEAKRIEDPGCTLRIRVSGNHEWGIRTDDDYTLFGWLVKRFDRKVGNYASWHALCPVIRIAEGTAGGIDYCDYYFYYGKEN